MAIIKGFSKGMGIGGWLTNYKRFNVMPNDWRMKITKGDEEHFKSYITEWDVINIKKMGLDHIRIGFDQIVVEETPYKYCDYIFDLIKEFIDNCTKNGLPVVLNLHKAIGNYCDIKEDISLFESDELKDRFIALWLEFERRFSDYDNVMFELLNEVKNIEPDLWNDLAERTICKIRKLNKSRKIIIGPVDWNSASKLSTLRLYDDKNIYYTFHMYSPHEFTHQRGVLFAEYLYYNRKMQYPSDDIDCYRDFHRLVHNRETYQDRNRIDIDYLRSELEGAIRFTKEHPNKVLWCGEFGTIRHCDINSRENWMHDVIEILNENEIPYCVWNYLSTPNDGNRFSLVDDDNREILSEKLLKIINGTYDL